MSGMTEAEVKHHVGIYVKVFIALACLTVLTVAVSYLHLALPLAVFIALLIAATKASLVALFFMHLVNEKRLIYAILALTVFFFCFLLTYPSLHHF